MQKPERYTDEEWTSILSQADEYGKLFEFGYPGTVYDADKKIWDFSMDESLCRMLDPDGKRQGKLCTLNLATLY